MIKERVSLPKGNDGVFSVFVYKQAQEIHGSIGQEILRQNREALNLSEVQNFSVKAKNTFSGKMKELPYHIKNDSEHPNLLFVEFPKELQEIASFNLIIEFDIPLESLADKLLHRLVELPFVEITKSTEKAPMVEDVVFVADVVPAIIGEKGERGEQGLQGIQGEKGEKGDRGEQGLQGERGQDGINGTNGENGKSALDYLNENNSEFIEKLKELLPQGGESGTNNFIDYLFPQNNMWSDDIKEEIRWKLHFILQNFEVVERGKIKLLQDERYNHPQADSVINSILPSDICLCFYKHSNDYLYFYPKYIKEINAMEDVYFNYYIFNNNTSNEYLLREFQWKQINLYDNANKIYLLIVEMASKKNILIEMDLSNIKDELKNINDYLMLSSYSDFTEKNVNDMDSLLDNYFFSRIVAQIGGNTESWRPDRFVSFSVESVETKEFEYLNNSIYNNMLPE